MCIPPQNGGKNCDGLRILEKDCNLKPCPTIIQHKTELHNEMLPTIRLQKISNRFQRYEVFKLFLISLEFLKNHGNKISLIF